MKIPILYEDDSLIAIHKPSGTVVNRAQSVKGETIADWAEKRLKTLDLRPQIQDEISKVFLDRSGIAHRLDKDTSGVLLIAKTPHVLSALMDQFKKREIEKEYQALVNGRLTPKEGTVNAPIGRVPWRHGLFGVMAGGKHAVTHYRVINYYERNEKKKREEFTLVNLRIETGRTHQIRVHLQYLGYPVVGDAFYAGKKRARKAKIWCPRIFLHAAHLALLHPETHKKIEINDPLPESLSQVLRDLQRINE